jgi:hypothetical protein
MSILQFSRDAAILQYTNNIFSKNYNPTSFMAIVWSWRQSHLASLFVRHVGVILQEI